MKITVLDANTLGSDLSLACLEKFGEVEVFSQTAPREMAERIKNTDVVVVNKLRMNEENMGDCPNLKLICETATGYDNIDLEFCKSRNIAVCNVVGYSTPSVVQLTVALALSLSVNAKSFTRFVESGEYSKSGTANRLEPVFHELCGKRWGIVGYGNIGKGVARVAEALGCRVSVFKRTPVHEAECLPLEEIMSECDYISVHLPLGEKTRGIISGEMISRMKPDAVLINVARGAVCDEEALANAIIDGKIGGIGIDVYSTEPFSEEHPFNRIKHFPNVMLTPHMAWGSYEARVRCINEVCSNIEEFLAGRVKNRII